MFNDTKQTSEHYAAVTVSQNILILQSVVSTVNGDPYKVSRSFMRP